MGSTGGTGKRNMMNSGWSNGSCTNSISSTRTVPETHPRGRRGELDRVSLLPMYGTRTVRRSSGSCAASSRFSRQSITYRCNNITVDAEQHFR